MIARRALSDAIQTVKELDEVMTEMAVVTDAGIGDYWSQLSEHTDRANDLGLAIKDVYKAETLYYQQGLKTNEVVAMSTETLKMARIAGLSAEDATDKMTAALRGFNMELNETSAQKVADVYSELAAITASDVNEISSAMTKTASIASSAGMEFETTAAFLSQIIETTRESAETAGTAMKTVIARFQELKKAPGEIGEVDGEIVDANKIETALRTVGVSLRDARGQFRDLDEVFLELSSKWDGLDTNTQRYIATIAAGSRQQSRFIAMMSDYSRTTELVTAANTSAGASQQQFEKTMDSLESKLNQLKNAWSEFTMGIMDSAFLKFGVDVLTTLLNIINNITAGIGKAGGMWEKFTGGLSKIGVIVTVVKLGEALVNKLFASLTQKATLMGKAIGDGIA
jgi:TP901 family phage tail tape measure protein